MNELESKIQIYSPGAQLKYRKRFCKTSPLNVQHLVESIIVTQICILC
jgi:hypothetical protein